MQQPREAIRSLPRRPRASKLTIGTSRETTEFARLLPMTHMALVRRERSARRRRPSTAHTAAGAMVRAPATLAFGG